MARFPIGIVGSLIVEAVFLADGSAANDPVTLLLSQGVLGVVVLMLWREYRQEKAARETLVNKLINDFVPLLTRGTEAMERMAKSDDDRKRR